MIKVICHTNLDLRNESWPKYLSCLPNIGDEMESQRKNKNGYRLSLKVVAIRWKWTESNEEYIPHIELHLNPSLWKTISDFKSWYEKTF